jgi:tetratricopeptide (TPR) repeat protein
MAKHVVPKRLRPSRDPERYLEASRAYDMACLAHFLVGELGESLYAVYRSLDLAVKAGPAAEGSAELARSQANVAASYGNVLRLHAPCRRYFVEANAHAEQSGLLSAQGSVLQVKSLYHVKYGHWDEAEQAIARSEEIHEQLGDRRRLGEATFLRSRILANDGQFETSLELTRKMIANARVGDDLMNELIGRAHAVLYLMILDRLEDAARYANESADLVPDDGFASEKVLVFGIQALALLRSDDRDGALGAFRRAAAAQPEADWTTHALEGFIAIADVAAALAAEAAEPDEFRNALTAAHQSIRKISMLGPNQSSITQAWRYRGIAARLAGKDAKATRCFEKSLKLADRYELLLERARSLYQLGRLDEARAIFAEKSAPYYVRRCDETPAT